jgi:ribosomal protein S18 acetylase RimI-like enzyme
VAEIRTLSAADYDAICTVWKASGVGYQPQGRESRANFEQQMATGLQIILGAFEGGRLAGVVLLTHDGRKGWINRLGVLPEFQRRGIGRQLVQAGEQMLRALGLTIIAALVEHSNPASLALFESAGYHVHETYYVTKRDRPDA